MKSVRIFYTKGGRMRFVSHLDMTRFMARMLRRAQVPLWYTEGFHPHPYITFALPLSLGFESTYEVMDLKLEQDDYPVDTLVARLNAVFPEYVRAFGAEEPVMKTGKIAFAHFDVAFADGGTLADSLRTFLSSAQILCQKKTKRGDLKEIDLVPKLKQYEVSLRDGNTLLSLVLPAGGQDNVNPELLIHAFFETAAQQYAVYAVVRTAVYDESMTVFR